MRGRSIVTVEMKDKYDKDTLPQVWDELRRKVSGAQSALPPGAGPSLVFDDYGDVYGVFLAVYGPEYSYAELKNVVEMLKKELLLVKDVARVETCGTKTEAVFIELNRERISQLGLSAASILNTLTDKNIVADAGRIKVGPEYIAVTPNGVFDSVDQFNTLLISGQGSESQIYLRDIATVRRGYVEPATNILRYDGNFAIGVGISTVSGGNVVEMGQAVTKRLSVLEEKIPLGIEIMPISFQSRTVTAAINNFVISLVEAVAIVIAVLMFFMGLRSAMLIGFVLILTIAGTFIFMGPFGVALERVSLGALIIALGMLVDNAIVVIDGMLIRVQRGECKRQAAIDVVGQTAFPLLGATVVAILAFAAIGTSQNSTGEFCRSLFQVVMYSLGLSWVTAVTITPLLGVMFLYVPKDGEHSQTHESRFFKVYRKFLAAMIRRRLLCVGVVGLMFVGAVFGFGFVKQSFFPDSIRPQFMVDFWLPQGTHIDTTLSDAREIEKYIRTLAGVEHVTSLVGQGALRFMLTYSPQQANSAYAQFLVDVEDYRIVDKLRKEIEAHIGKNYPAATCWASKMALGPPGGKIELRISGPYSDVLRALARKTEDIFYSTGMLKAVRTNWRHRVKRIRIDVAEEQANLNGIGRGDIAQVLRQSFDGARVGVFREGDELLPVILRAPEVERSDISSLNSLQIFSPNSGRSIPLRQVVDGVETVFEDEIIARLNRKRTLTVSAEEIVGFVVSDIQKLLFDRIKELDVPEGYSIEWGGEYENSKDASASLGQAMPVIFLLMVLTVIALFNNLRQPLIIWLCVPLAIIGVTVGLLLTGQPFGFMAILGFLSLSGMLIKNAVVLIDEINSELAGGRAPIDAVLNSGVSRLRPVSMAAATTALGMIPLLFDAFLFPWRLRLFRD